MALHRLAYLVALKPEYFSQKQVVTIVFNPALARYIGKVLPALGVSGVTSWIYHQWAGQLRQQHFPGWSGVYEENTPVSVIELKRHPALLAWYEEQLIRYQQEWELSLFREVSVFPEGPLVRQAWKALADKPLVSRILDLQDWMHQRISIFSVSPCPVSYPLHRRFDTFLESQFPGLREHPESMALLIWQESLLQEAALKEAIHRHAPDQFSDFQLTEVWKWAVEHYRVSIEGEDEETREDEEEMTAELKRNLRLDEEDDTLLLLLYCLTAGSLRSKHQKILQYHHVLLDEAQDYSPLELKLILQVTPPRRRSLTLAGDLDQKITLGNSFQTWEELLSYLQLAEHTVSSLKVGYRSTREIMEVAKRVIAPISVNTEWNATRSGPPVEFFQFQNEGELVDHLAKALTQFVYQSPYAYLAILARYRSQADSIYKGLLQAEIPALRRVNDQNFSFQPGIEVTDIAQSKGLEFDNVVIINADHQTYPDDSIARHLLYVGITRPAHQLWMVSCRRPSPLIPLDLVQSHLF